MGGGSLIGEDDEHSESADTEDDFVYQAIVSYLCPIKAAIGVKAQTRKEAEGIIQENFSEYLDFELISLEPATPEQAEQLKGSVSH